MEVADAEKPFYEREGWRPMSEDNISRIINHFRSQPQGNLVHIPEFICEKEDLNFEETNRSATFKELVSGGKKPQTARDRLRAKLEERKKSAAIEDKEPPGDGST